MALRVFLALALPWPHLPDVHPIMLRSYSRRIATLLVALLMTAVNGGALALDSNWDETAAVPNPSQLVIEVSSLASDIEQLDGVDRDDDPQARQSAPICKAGSSDCGGPLPTVSDVTGGLADLWLWHAATTHRDHRSEHQLRPPRI